MKSAELAQRWASQSHQKGTANNAWFSGRDFYHYGTQIAGLIDGADGSPVALVSRHQFSSGTSKVQGELRAAARGAGLTTFTVDSVKADHAANLAWFECEALEREGMKTKARRPEMHQDAADELRRSAAAYRAAFGL